MSLHKKEEFRALCGGVSVQHLSTYIKRGKVVLNEQGYIDDSNPLNQEHLRKFQVKNGGAISVSELAKLDRFRKKGGKVDPKDINRQDVVSDGGSIHPLPEKKEEVKKPKKKLEVKSPAEVERTMTPAFVQSESVVSNSNDLDAMKKKLEVEKLKKDIELKNIDIQKKMGLVIPVDLVEGVFARHSDSFVVKFKQGVDNFADEFAHKYGVSRADIGKFRAKAIDIINESITEALDMSSREIESIVSEYKSVKK